MIDRRAPIMLTAIDTGRFFYFHNYFKPLLLFGTPRLGDRNSMGDLASAALKTVHFIAQLRIFV
jgi:hypothetical protein